MRIAIVTNNARVVGGVESYLDTVIPLLEAAGHEIALLCEDDAPTTLRPISRSTSAPVWSVAEIGAARWLDSLRRWRPDVIYTHGLSNPEFEARALAVAPAIAYAHDYRATCISGAKAFAFPATTPCVRRFGTGCLVNFYPRRCGGLNPMTMLTDFRRASRQLELLRSLRAVLTASEFVRAEYVRNGLAPEAVRCVGYPVVDRGGVRPVTPETLAGASSAAPLRLLFAGRMEPLKGGRVLLDALPLISSALSRPLVLTFAGDGGARFEWARRADAINRRHPALRVEFTGWIETAALAALFDLSDLLVVPSLWPEPFGLVGPEAGMRGLPAAAFAAGGIPEWLTDGANGALAYGLPPTPADLANAIVRCLRDPVDHARLRNGAIELARRFSPERHLQALIEVFYQISKQSSAVSAPADGSGTIARAV
jgi:glycosyltransferase involved in cell wall biosynthesis